MEGMVDAYCIFLHRIASWTKGNMEPINWFQKWQLAHHMNEKLCGVWGSCAQQPLWVLGQGSHSATRTWHQQWHPGLCPYSSIPSCTMSSSAPWLFPACAPAAALGSFAAPNKHSHYSVISTNFPKALTCLFLLCKSFPYLSLLIVPQQTNCWNYFCQLNCFLLQPLWVSVG